MEQTKIWDGAAVREINILGDAWPLGDDVTDSFSVLFEIAWLIVIYLRSFFFF